MTTPQTDPELPPVPPFLLDAASRQGWLMAGEAIRHLENVGILPPREKRQKRPISVAPELLLELAALLRLNSWQNAGLLEWLQEEDRVGALRALDDSEATLASDPSALAQEEGLPPLADRVYSIWERHCAWSGLEELTADVLLNRAAGDEEEVLRNLADLLWELRYTNAHPTES